MNNAMKRRDFLRASASLAAGAGIALTVGFPRAGLAAAAAPRPAKQELPLRVLGRTGVKVSILGLGGDGLISDSTDKDAVIRFLTSVLDSGINFIDTAHLYGKDGRCEKNLGLVMGTHRRDGVFLATKTGARMYDTAMRQIDTSLKRLQVDRLDLVQVYYDLGVRHMLFAYNRNNLAGGGCHDEDTGLTDFGRVVIDEMNRVGMVIDCSHSAYTTTMEAMQRSTAPVIFSHSNALALADHGRNIRDDQIRACADGGGVIGINGLSLFLGDDGKAKAETAARHVAYIADLVGHEHVGISLDFDPPIENGDGSESSNSAGDAIEEDPEYWPPEAGYDRPIDFLPLNSLPGVCDELFHLGFTEPELAGILGGNFRRIAERVWK